MKKQKITLDELAQKCSLHPERIERLFAIKNYNPVFDIQRIGYALNIDYRKLLRDLKGQKPTGGLFS